MIHLIYVSRATQEMSDADLLQLLEQSRTRNQRQNITGLLLYAGDKFFQVLEGELEDVEQIYESIFKDSRNTGNIVLEKQEIKERSFPTWSMGFRHLTADQHGEIPGYTQFFDKTMTPGQIAARLTDVISLMYSFRLGK